MCRQREKFVLIHCVWQFDIDSRAGSPSACTSKFPDGTIPAQFSVPRRYIKSQIPLYASWFEAGRRQASNQLA